MYDIEGNGYDTEHIGSQIWMKQNLKTTHYNNGDTIQHPTTNVDWANTSTGAYANYNNDTSTVSTYGRLYNYYTVADTRKMCPTNWHVPTDADWTALTTYLGGESNAGGKLKETGYTHWVNNNYGATNETGFTALASGYRYYSGPFNMVGYYGYWWTSTDISTTNAYQRTMYDSNASVYRTDVNKHYGYSIRCVKD